MLKKFTFALSCTLGLASFTPSFAADTEKPADAPKKTAAEAKPAGEVATEMKAIVASVREKLKAGKKTEADLADELKRFDDLLAKHKDEKTEEVAMAAYMKATLYSEVLRDPEKAKEMLEKITKDFPDTKMAKTVASKVKALEMQSKLGVGKQFPDFKVSDVDGKPLSISEYKGKVVLIDFWATWCGPCVGELPNVKKAYAKHHGDGFEIIGISLDSDKEKLTGFVAKNEMTWRQFFDGKGWQNQLAQEYGINSIPATFLLDGEGKVIGSNLRGEALEEAVAKALKKDSK